MSLDFGSAIDGLWLWLMSLYILVSGVLTLGAGVAALRYPDIRRGLLAFAILMGVQAGWLSTVLHGHLERFETLTFQADGGWLAEDALGLTVMQLAPDAMRAVNFKSRLYEGARLTWVEVELPDGRRFASVEAGVDAQRGALNALKAQIEPHQ